MSVTYNKTNWVNDVTPLDANNMNNIENGIENLVNEVNGSTITVDSELSETSENPVQNKVITAKLNNKADINNPLSLIEAYRKSQGFLIHDYAPSTGEKYVLNPKDGVTLDDTIYGKSKIPSSYVVGQYVQAKIAAMTPVKGTDYFTEADKQEIINAVIAELSKQQ